MIEKEESRKDNHSEKDVESQVDEEINFDEIPPEMGHFLRAVPKESRREIYSLMVSGSMIRSPEADIAKKVTSEHITQMLENQSASMDYSFRDNRQTKWIWLIVFIVSVVFIGCLIVFLKDNPELLEKVLTILISGGLGAFGGYGLGKNRKE